MIARVGAAQVDLWRRSFDVPPPALPPGDPRRPELDPLYAGVEPSLLPDCESLKDTSARVVPYFEQAIAPRIRAGKGVLIAAHGNSLRALVKYLDGRSAEAIIPNGVPLVYELDENLKPLRSYYLEEAPAAVV